MKEEHLMKEVIVIVIHNEVLQKQYQKLQQLSFTTLAKNFREASMLLCYKSSAILA